MAKLTANQLLEQLGTQNPYRRNRANSHAEYWIYQAGWLAGFLASAVEQNPQLARQLKQKLERRPRC